MYRAWVGLLSLLLCVGCCSGSHPKDPQVLAASHIVGMRAVTAHDRERARDLSMRVWYPVAEGVASSPAKSPYRWGRIAQDAPVDGAPRPLLILSHGFGGTPSEYAWLVQPLVEAGFVVAAVQHHDLPGPHVNHWNRALDLHFLLNHIFASDLAPAIDRDRIGVIGFSLGGMGALWLAGARTDSVAALVPDDRFVGSEALIADAQAALTQANLEAWQKSYRDARIKAAFLMAPAWSWAASDEGLAQVSVPVGIVAGTADEIVVTKTNAERIARLVPDCDLWLIQDAGHLVFVGEPTWSGQSEVPSWLYTDKPGIDRQYVQEHVRELALQFFKRVL